MPLSTIPEKTEESLGIVKSDVLPYTDPETQVPAEQYERLKDAVIANALAIGLGDGSTPGSLEARLGALPGGAIIAAWEDDEDADIFGAPQGYKNDLGGGPLGTPSISVVAGSGIYTGVNLLRMSVADDGNSTLSGGYMWPLDLGSEDLPDRYVLEYAIAGFDVTGSCVPMTALAFKPDATLANRRGMLHRKDAGGAGNSIVWARANSSANDALTLANTVDLTTARVAIMPLRFRAEVFRPNGSATYAVSISSPGSVGGAEYLGGSDTESRAQAAVDDCTVCGPGVYNNGANGLVTGIDLLYFRLREWRP